MVYLKEYHEQLNKLKEGSDQKSLEKWFSHVELYGTFFEYCLRRAELTRKMAMITLSNLSVIDSGKALSASLRNQLITMNEEINSLAEKYYKQASNVPGNMIAQTCAKRKTVPSPWVSGYNNSLDNFLQVKQFDGSLEIPAIPLMKPGQPFELKVELQNRGCIPWVKGAGYELRVKGETGLSGLNDTLPYEGDTVVFADRCTITLKGSVPIQPGEAQIRIEFFSPAGQSQASLGKTIDLKWY